MEAVLGGPGVFVVAVQLEAAAELEGEVEAAGVIGGEAAGGGHETCVADYEGLEAVARSELEALAEGAETGGVGPTGSTGFVVGVGDRG